MRARVYLTLVLNIEQVLQLEILVALLSVHFAFVGNRGTLNVVCSKAT